MREKDLPEPAGFFTRREENTLDFKVLCVGDVVGDPGMDRISRSLRYLKRRTGADFVIVNGENASVVGITPRQAEKKKSERHTQ